MHRVLRLASYCSLSLAAFAFGAWLGIPAPPVVQVVDLNSIGFQWNGSITFNPDESRRFDLYRIPPSQLSGPRGKNTTPLFRNGRRMYSGYFPEAEDVSAMLDHYLWWDFQEGLGLLVPIPRGADPAAWFAQNSYQLRYGKPRPRKPGEFNVVLTIYDACRPDRLSCYGGPHRMSPVLDDIASRGVRFNQALSQGGWTMESVASLFTGLLPPAHGSNYVYDEQGCVPASLKTMAEMFREAGYTTALVTHQLLFVGNIGYEQGFDLSGWGGVEDAQGFLRLNRDHPFFLILYEANPHHPYDPAPEYNRFLPPGGGKEIDPAIWLDSAALRKASLKPEDYAVLQARYDGEILQNDQTVLKPL
ncbi:MAG: sulfatase-like hydrolase/transferase [Candidatus Sumerlaeota bacterium]|nr:sulfatase-like hydrolase/transferase [Candidatus Sumerlaeota bacterium]